MGNDAVLHLKTWGLYYHTLRHLRVRQIIGRLINRYYRPRLERENLPNRRLPSKSLVEIPSRVPSMVSEDGFVLLNKHVRVKSALDWNDPQQEVLWLYNLHYFDDLNALEAESRFEWHRALINRWIRENPPAVGIGWEPYPLSLRVVNWIKWDLRMHGLDEVAIESLGLQLRWLRRRLEYHLLGNHLLANAKALIFGGLYFGGSEPERWFRTGWRIFDEQLKEQVLQDGGHFELSPMYHLIVLEDVLDVLNICQAYEVATPPLWREIAVRMLDWAAAMCHPDGEIPFFNDAAFSVSRTYAELADYAKRLFGYQKGEVLGSVYLRDSGYLRLVRDVAVVFFDVAQIGPDYLPGHGHADTLSVELSLFGQRVLVNSGTSLYGTGPERERQRGTGAHNTVMVDGENSSEVWGGFRVARRARARVLECVLDRGVAIAEHDGYCRFNGAVMHRREVTLEARTLTIVDTVYSYNRTGTSRHVAGAWHLHPSIQVSQSELSRGDASESARLQLRVPTGTGLKEVTMTLSGPSSVSVEPSTWHPEFGRSQQALRVVFACSGSLPIVLTTRLEWMSGHSAV